MKILFYQINYLLIICGSFFLIVFLAFRQKRRDYTLFMIFNASIILWAIGRLGLLLVQDAASALLFARILYIGSIFIYIFFLHFILAFLGLESRRKYVLYIFYANALFLSVINFIDLFYGTNNFIYSVTPKLFFNFYEVPGRFYLTQTISNLLIPFYAVIELIREYRLSTGLRRGQIRYVLLASFLGFSGGSTILFLIYDIPVQPFGISLIILQFFIIAYAITRYRLVGIHVVFQKVLVYLCLFSLFSVFYFSSSILIQECSRAIPFPTLFNVVISVITFIALFSFLEKRLGNFFSKIVFKDYYEFADVSHALSLSISSNLSLEKMIDETFSILAKAMNVKRVSFLVYNKDFKKLISKKNFSFQDNNKEIVSIGEDSPLVKYLHQEKKMLISEEMESFLLSNEKSAVPNEIIKESALYLNKLGVSLCQPIIKEDKLIAILCFGAKISGDSFNTGDLKLIEIYSHQVSVALENYLAYEEIKSKKEQLEKSMKLMVGRELEMINMKKALGELNAK
jgi:hypothetical protein